MASRLSIAAVVLGLLTFTAPSASAFVLKHTAGGALVHWHRAEVAWLVDASVYDVPGAEEAANAAIAAWSGRDGAPRLTIDGAPSSTRLEPGLDGNNVIFYAPGGFEPAGKALAVTLLSFDDATGEVLDADIVLNGKYRLAPVDIDVARRGDADEHEQRDDEDATYDIRRVLAHELGHGLALSDEPARSDSLMYPYVPKARALATSPSSDDLAGIATLYARGTSDAPREVTPPGTAPSERSSRGGCGGAIVARSGPASSPLTYLALGLVLAAFVLARGKRKGAGGAAGCAIMAAAALVAPLPVVPSTSPSVDAGELTVTAVETTASGGLFRSHITLQSTECAVRGCSEATTVEIWGGRMGGVRQVIAGREVPARGDRVRVRPVERGAGRPAP